MPLYTYLKMKELIKILRLLDDPDDTIAKHNCKLEFKDNVNTINISTMNVSSTPLTSLIPDSGRSVESCDTSAVMLKKIIEPAKKIIVPIMDDYETGDILLFSDRSFIPSRLIEYFTDSKYSHVGIILKNPTCIDTDLNKGLYLMESTQFTDIVDSEDKKLKSGTQIRKLEDVYAEYNGAIFWRKLNTLRDEKFYQILTDAHSVVHNKPYDMNPKDWIESLLNIKFGDVQVTSRFFCSALVTYFYDRWGFVDKSTPWTIIRPKDLGTENVLTNRIKLICDIDKEVVIKNYDSYVHYIYYTY